ncbi:methyltransferase [Sorangium cellulosum]|uniref:Methyltransferase n=1 Tax=Sorangium cellulosum TaxID=56 RepID=A0A4P2Q4W6_SORCE|nr:methyltransferase [Sorangium cellulosum]AUX24086.1 methyltransferase [Sorangium cellulosum]
MDTISPQDWTALCGLMNGWVQSTALGAACELGLFDFLSRRPGATVEDVAAGLDITRHGARVLLLACSATGTVQRDGSGAYANTALAEAYLRSDAPLSMASFVAFNQKVQQVGCQRLAESLRQGRNAGLDAFPGPGDTLYQRLAADPASERLFQTAMAAYTRLAPGMIEAEELSAARVLVDVGGGDGTNAMRLCRRFPELTVTLVDLPSVCAIARKRVEEAGLERRIRCVEADMFRDPWPEGDAVLLSHVVEIFAEERVRFLYAKACERLPPGGRLFAWTLTCADDESGGLQAAKSSIYFVAVASGHGMAYPASQHERWLKGAGFGELRRHDARHLDHTLLVATKPGP